MKPGASAPLLLALTVDLAVGEPPARIHPVVGMGKLIEFLVRWAPAGPRRELAYGTLVVSVTTLLPALGAKILLGKLRAWPLRLLVEAFLLKSCFAYRALEEAGRSVAELLAGGDLPTAREELRALVSRDRSGLDESLVSAAAVESLAENLSDGFVAPLTAYALGGTPAALFYRAANTADSMIGYRGEYEYLGKAAARLDDSLNLLPARLTALLIVAASVTNCRRAWYRAQRDHAGTSSPNAGWPMAAIAGALDVALRKPKSYCLNEGARAPAAGDIRRAIYLVRKAAGFWVVALMVMALNKKAA